MTTDRTITAGSEVRAWWERNSSLIASPSKGCALHLSDEISGRAEKHLLRCNAQTSVTTVLCQRNTDILTE